ncbi:MAG: hypothetical protein ABIW47_14285 [Ginsengibacter sp.]|jgi:hypothetical protein
MEIKFDMDNFEHSLKQHADEFSMIPSKRVWNGVYNSLHPGSKWPSLTMVLIFLLTLVGIGPLNNSPRNIAFTSLPDNTQKSISEENETNLFSINSFQKNEKNVSDNNTPGKVVTLNNSAEETRVKLKSAVKNISSSNSGAPIIPEKKSFSEIAKVKNTLNQREIIEQSLEETPKAIIANIRNYKKDITSISKAAALEVDYSIHNNFSIDLKNNFNLVERGSLASLLKLNSGQSVLIQIDDSQPESETKVQAEGETNVQVELKQPSKQAAKRNSKATWIFFATPSVSTTYFTGEDYKNHNGAVNSSPLIVNPNQVGNSMRFNARLGLNVGAELNYAFANGWEIVSGTQISYSGYNILAHKVHPTFSYLYLKDEANSMVPHKYITYYGSGLGLDEVVLHNKSIQITVPLGIKHSVWKNNNMEIKVGTSVQPSLLLNGHSYILSTDGRNYITDENLMRTVNVIGEFNSSISFQGDKVKWHVGPVVRYQALSSYKNDYPVNEHLIDYGIRIGISK